VKSSGVTSVNVISLLHFPKDIRNPVVPSFHSHEYGVVCPSVVDIIWGGVSIASDIPCRLADVDIIWGGVSIASDTPCRLADVDIIWGGVSIGRHYVGWCVHW